MKNTKSFYWLAQILGWTAYCGLIVLSVYTNNPDRLNWVFFVNVLLLIVCGIGVTHFQRSIFIRLGWLDKRLPELLPRIIISSFISSILIAGIDLLGDYFSKLYLGNSTAIGMSEFVVNILAVFVLVLGWNGIYFTFHFFQKSRKQEVFNLELEASKRESELKNLRSQLNPHFLFNSLNSIKALIDIEPQKAREAVTTLSNLLRQSLQLGKLNQIQLSEELKLVKNYLDLEKIRFEDRLKVKWEVDPGMEAFEIPSFALQMMVENAVKHGITTLHEGGILRIAAGREGDSVFVLVENPGKLSQEVDLGVGIENIRLRLKLHYGEKASFSIIEQNGVICAKIIFQK